MPTATLARRWRSPRLLWVVPGLAIAVLAGMRSDDFGFGPLVPLLFGLGPHAGWVLGLTGVVVGHRFARTGTTVHNVLHHPLPPTALVVAGLAGLVSPWWLVGGLAWLGHVVIGWGLGDGHKAADAPRPHRPTLGRLRLRRPAATSSRTAG